MEIELSENNKYHRSQPSPKNIQHYSITKTITCDKKNNTTNTN